MFCFVAMNKLKTQLRAPGTRSGSMSMLSFFLEGTRHQLRQWLNGQIVLHYRGRKMIEQIEI